MLEEKVQKAKSDSVALQGDFLVRTASKYASKTIGRDLAAAERAIQTLDEEAGLGSGSAHALWPTASTGELSPDEDQSYSNKAENDTCSTDDRASRLNACIMVIHPNVLL